LLCGPKIEKNFKFENGKYHKFLGFIAPEERKRIISKAKAIIAPTLYTEPCGWAIIEGFFSGTPALTTPSGGLKENNINGLTGFHCSNMEDFVEKLDRIGEISPQSCLNHAKLNFSIWKQAENYEKCFTEILRQSSFRLRF
jgi:glycosyltransferase involved in cell wall biosynthesis